MSLLYQYASLMFGGVGDQPKAWYQKVSSLLPRRKKNELKACQRQDINFLYSSFLYAIHLEIFWWIETNGTEFYYSRRFIFPQWDTVSMSSSLAWKLYWIELKQRVFPPLMTYQATFLFMHLFKGFLTSVISKESMLRLYQHPPRRAVAIAEREPDRLLVGVEVFVASLWANTLFFAANYTVSQIAAWYKVYITNSRSSRFGDRESAARLSDTSWSLFLTNAQRLFYSAMGAGLGSMVWPGWGTLLGIGMGDELARKQRDSGLPQQVISIIRGGLNNPFFHVLGRFRVFYWWPSTRAGGRSGREDDDDDDKDTIHKPLHDDLVCGCCQTTPFSSDPNSKNGAPISSRSCSHTICKSCVKHCHLALVELSSSSSTCDEWIKCPLCNSLQAFSANNHIVNRTLCAAIAAIEESNQETSMKKL